MAWTMPATKSSAPSTQETPQAHEILRVMIAVPHQRLLEAVRAPALPYDTTLSRRVEIPLHRMAQQVSEQKSLLLGRRSVSDVNRQPIQISRKRIGNPPGCEKETTTTLHASLHAQTIVHIRDPHRSHPRLDRRDRGVIGPGLLTLYATRDLPPAVLRGKIHAVEGDPGTETRRDISGRRGRCRPG